MPSWNIPSVPEFSTFTRALSPSLLLAQARPFLMTQIRLSMLPSLAPFLEYSQFALCFLVETFYKIDKIHGHSTKNTI